MRRLGSVSQSELSAPTPLALLTGLSVKPLLDVLRTSRAMVGRMRVQVTDGQAARARPPPLGRGVEALADRSAYRRFGVALEGSA